jgi:hypothetical protein
MKENALMIFVGIILFIIFLGSLYISYNNGFSDGLNSFCNDKGIVFNHLSNVYECNNSKVGVFWDEI